MKLEDALTLVNTIVERNREARINCGFAPDEFSAVARAMAVQCVQAAVLEEREACIKVAERHASNKSPPYKDHEDNYLDGWLDASNEIGWAIRSRGE